MCKRDKARKVDCQERRNSLCWLLLRLLKKVIAWNGWPTVWHVVKILLLALGILVVVATPVWVWLAYRNPRGIYTEITADGALSFLGEVISGGVFAAIIAWWQHRRENRHGLDKRRNETSPNIQIKLERNTGNTYAVAVSNCGEKDAVRICLNTTPIVYILRCGATEWVDITVNNGGEVTLVRAINAKNDRRGDPCVHVKNCDNIKPDGTGFKGNATSSSSTTLNANNNNISTIVCDLPHEPISDLPSVGIPYPSTLHLQYQNCDREDIAQTFTHIENGFYAAGEPDYSKSQKSGKSKIEKSREQLSDKQPAAPQ